ncbi:hypothetical protein HAZT_HAZT001104 [Hyalella azteca]|uniref:CTLH domain-containing protein n=1 Tax=Hyalella azteca TaxID=294128 RepID=A0A6A0HBS9_HYAAZ|nr:hypothetical protein HAZT_HAZT001104 [Hyalella azteca]
MYKSHCLDLEEFDGVTLNHGAFIDILASWEDPHYGGASPPPRKKLKRTQGGVGCDESCSSGGGKTEESLGGTASMQHQTEVTNGASVPQLNGSSDGGSAVTVNGVKDETKKALKLDPINRDMVRLIGQHLANLGFHTVEQLMAESGCRLDHPEARRFKSSVVEGDWQAAEAALLELQSMLNNTTHLTEMRFLILEQKYMELLERGDDIGALNCLRGEISPLDHNISRVHRLSSLIFYNNPAELKKATNWLGSGPESHMALMERLSAYLPPSVMLPPRRLERLVIQSVQHQVATCEFHNTSIEPLLKVDNLEGLSLSDVVVSSSCLLTDHHCGKEHFPSTCLYTVTEHMDEVLVAAFSPNGRYLATAGKDFSLLIWNVDNTTLKISKRHCLDGHNFSIVFLSWSHDSTKIIACMHEDASELIVWDAERGKQVCKVSDSTSDSLTCACWYKDNERFVCGGLRGQFYLCNLEGAVLERWEGVRVQSLAVHADGKTVLASDTHRRIRGYQLETVQDYSILQEDHGIMTFSLDTTGRFALLNVTTQGLHLWDLNSRTLVRRFRGATQKHCTIHSCFGGINQDFIASGSEGHQLPVNCVTWNPVQPSMLVSVSDDRTIRIWGPSQTNRLNRDADAASTSGGLSDGDDDEPDSPRASNFQFPHSLISGLDISSH